MREEGGRWQEGGGGGEGEVREEGERGRMKQSTK